MQLPDQSVELTQNRNITSDSAQPPRFARRFASARRFDGRVKNKSGDAKLPF